MASRGGGTPVELRRTPSAPAREHNAWVHSRQTVERSDSRTVGQSNSQTVGQSDSRIVGVPRTPDRSRATPSVPAP
eukprot:9389337-Pyramimonas_sp.AAC.1